MGKPSGLGALSTSKSNTACLISSAKKGCSRWVRSKHSLWLSRYCQSRRNQKTLGFPRSSPKWSKKILPRFKFSSIQLQLWLMRGIKLLLCLALAMKWNYYVLAYPSLRQVILECCFQNSWKLQSNLGVLLGFFVRKSSTFTNGIKRV